MLSGEVLTVATKSLYATFFCCGDCLYQATTRATTTAAIAQNNRYRSSFAKDGSPRKGAFLSRRPGPGFSFYYVSGGGEVYRRGRRSRIEGFLVVVFVPYPSFALVRPLSL